MNRLVLAAAFALAMSAMFPAPVLAQGGGFDPAVLDKLAEEIHQVPLTEDMINRFVASHPEMKEVGAKFPATKESEGARHSRANPVLVIPGTSPAMTVLVLLKRIMF
ncbi:MAG: hypothetical protein ABWY38_05560 [Methyloceanibacter sp.]